MQFVVVIAVRAVRTATALIFGREISSEGNRLMVQIGALWTSPKGATESSVLFEGTEGGDSDGHGSLWTK